MLTIKYYPQGVMGQVEGLNYTVVEADTYTVEHAGTPDCCITYTLGEHAATITDFGSAYVMNKNGSTVDVIHNGQRSARQ